MKKIKFNDSDIMDVLGEYFYDEVEKYLKNNKTNQEIIDGYWMLSKVIESEDMDEKYYEWLKDTWFNEWDDYIYNIIYDSLYNAKFTYYYDRKNSVIYLLIDNKEIPLIDILMLDNIYIDDNLNDFEKVNFCDFADDWNKENK